MRVGAGIQWARLPDQGCAKATPLSGPPATGGSLPVRRPSRRPLSPRETDRCQRPDAARAAGRARTPSACCGAPASAPRPRSSSSGRSARASARSTGSPTAGRGRTAPAAWSARRRGSTASRWIPSTSGATTCCGGWTGWSAASARCRRSSRSSGTTTSQRATRTRRSCWPRTASCARTRWAPSPSCCARSRPTRRCSHSSRWWTPTSASPTRTTPAS